MELWALKFGFLTAMSFNLRVIFLSSLYKQIFVCLFQNERNIENSSVVD
jgi:hypothetical protein